MRLIAAERELDPLLHCSKGLTQPSPRDSRVKSRDGEEGASIGEELLAGMTLLRER
jgi:hypothetical protein